jgi:hypothetical protein
MCVSCECCVLSRRADQSIRGILPKAVCLSVIVKPHQLEGTGSLGIVER